MSIEDADLEICMSEGVSHRFLTRRVKNLRSALDNDRVYSYDIEICMSEGVLDMNIREPALNNDRVYSYDIEICMLSFITRRVKKSSVR